MNMVSISARFPHFPVNARSSKQFSAIFGHQIGVVPHQVTAARRVVRGEQPGRDQRRIFIGHVYLRTVAALDFDPLSSDI
jgi:hypothetical protein